MSNSISIDELLSLKLRGRRISVVCRDGELIEGHIESIDKRDDRLGAVKLWFVIDRDDRSPRVVYFLALDCVVYCMADGEEIYIEDNPCRATIYP